MLSTTSSGRSTRVALLRTSTSAGRSTSSAVPSLALPAPPVSPRPVRTTLHPATTRVRPCKLFAPLTRAHSRLTLPPLASIAPSAKALPEARETSHSPAALQHGSVPTSSTGPTNVLSSTAGSSSATGPAAFGGASAAGAGATAAAAGGDSAKSPSSALEAAKTSHRDDTPSASVPKVVESDGPHGLVKTADGSYKHRHELTEAELAEHDRRQSSSGDQTTVGSSAATSGTAAHPKGVDAGSSVPPHRDIDTAAANQGAGLGATTASGHGTTPLSPAKSTASDSSLTPSGHKKKQSLSEKLKTALHLGKEK